MRRRQLVRRAVGVSSGQDIHRAEKYGESGHGSRERATAKIVEEEGDIAAGMPVVTGTDEKHIARHQFGDDVRARRLYRCANQLDPR